MRINHTLPINKGIHSILQYYKNKMNENIRRIKIYPKHSARKDIPFKIVPEIRLSGLWLKDAGFFIGDSINVEVSKNKMIIRISTENKK